MHTLREKNLFQKFELTAQKHEKDKINSIHFFERDQRTFLFLFPNLAGQ